jgi:hypothetical protein
MKLINAKEVVNKLKQGGAADISEAYFGKLVSMGKIPFHTTPGKKRKMFIYAEAKKGLIESRDPSRDSQREAIALAKINKRLERGEIDHNTAQDELKAIEEVVSSGILTDTDMPSELVELLSEIVDPGKALSISKEFWTAKIQKQKFLKEQGDLISLGDAKAVIDMLFSPMSARLDSLHVELKGRFPSVSIEATEWLGNEINNMKQMLQDHKWEIQE